MRSTLTARHLRLPALRRPRRTLGPVERPRVTHYRWEELRPDQQRAVYALIEAARVQRTRHRRRFLALSLLLAAGAVTAFVLLRVGLW